MMRALRLSLNLLRGGGRRDAQMLALSVAAVTIALTVVALTLGSISALDARDQRTDWQRPAAVAKADARAWQSLGVDFVAGRPVAVVRLAARTTIDKAPVPPGMTAFPAPGQAAWSPALRELLADRPGQAAALAGKDVRAVSTLGKDALAAPEELVAVLGVPLKELRNGTEWSDPLLAGRLAGPTSIDDFTGASSGKNADAREYVSLGWIAAVLLLVPVLTLGGAAIRLGSRRRSIRFALLRLAGAPARLVRGVLAVEVALIGLVAALVAWPTARLLTLGLSHVPVGGITFHSADLTLGLWQWLLLTVVTILLMFVSALPALGAAMREPLAVVGTYTPRSPGWWRVLVALVVVVAFTWVANGDEASVLLIMMVFAGMFSVLNLLGPLVANLLGRIMLRLSHTRGAGMLLAARRVLDDPRAVWRLVSGVVLAGFVAGFLALFQVGGAGAYGAPIGTYEIVVPASEASAAVDRAVSALDRAGYRLPVSVGETQVLFAASAVGSDEAALKVRLRGNASADEIDAIRGALLAEFPGNPAASAEEFDDFLAQFAHDFTKAALVILLTSLLVAAASTAITVAATTLDRREVYHRMWQAGLPVDILDRARTLETVVPLVVGTALAIGAGLFAAAPLTLNTEGVSASGVGLLVLTGGLGTGAILLAVRASRPLLTAVARS